MTQPHNPVPALLTRWREARAELRAIEEALHPDLTDRHGRTWQWRDQDLYVHDDILAAPAHLVLDESIGLPIPGLAEHNPNYAGLCAICRREDDSLYRWGGDTGQY